MPLLKYNIELLPMVQNDLFRKCLASIPEEQKIEFDLSFGIAERISDVLKA